VTAATGPSETEGLQADGVRQDRTVSGPACWQGEVRCAGSIATARQQAAHFDGQADGNILWLSQELQQCRQLVGLGSYPVGLGVFRGLLWSVEIYRDVQAAI
jgi:hypothetical protein